jgi:hypothetical protein
MVVPHPLLFVASHATQKLVRLEHCLQESRLLQSHLVLLGDRLLQLV